MKDKRQAHLNSLVPYDATSDSHFQNGKFDISVSDLSPTEDQGIFFPAKFSKKGNEIFQPIQTTVNLGGL